MMWVPYRSSDRQVVLTGRLLQQYYEAVGPLPSRPLPPLWRSPPASPSKPSAELKDDEELTTAAAIEAHKQEISRHREHWDRGTTPPGFWMIGFPDTQQVAAMNAEAALIHERKRAFIAEEAE